MEPSKMAMIILDDELTDGSLTILNVFEFKLELQRKEYENTIAYIAVSFLTPLHWQSIHRLSRDAHRTIDAYWRCARRNVLHRMRVFDDGRCEICGWLPSRRFSPTTFGLCYECGWQNICEDCTYVVPGRGRRCVDCDEVPRGIFPPSRRKILVVRNFCCDLVDVLMGHGLAHAKGQLEPLPEELVRLASLRRK